MTDVYAPQMFTWMMRRRCFFAATEAKAGDVFNGTGSTTVTLRELAEAIGAALKLPARSVSREEAEARGPVPDGVCSFENRPSNRKAVQQLGWQPKGIDMLTDIRSGSYRELAENCDRLKRRVCGLERAKQANWLFALQSPVTCIRLVAPDYRVCTRKKQPEVLVRS